MGCNHSLEIQKTKAQRPCWWTEQEKLMRNLLLSTTNMAAVTCNPKKRNTFVLRKCLGIMISVKQASLRVFISVIAEYNGMESKRKPGQHSLPAISGSNSDWATRSISHLLADVLLRQHLAPNGSLHLHQQCQGYGEPGRGHQWPPQEIRH